MSERESEARTEVDLRRLDDEATVLLDDPGADLGATLQPEVIAADDTATVIDSEAATLPPGAATTSDRTLERGFDLQGILGEGGMGVVHLATQRELGRDVAIKTLRGELAGRGAERSSFLAESLVTGALQHPNVVPIHSVSQEPSGEIWLIMKRVEGRSLAEILDAETRPLDEERTETLLRMVLSVCQALSFAHDRGVLHRDIKPENVMLGDYGEVLLVDWGIAVRYRDVEADSPLAAAPLASEVEMVAGTPRYMPPEMARGDGEAQGPWTDTHLVGGLLYQILSGTPPHRGSTLRDVLQQAQTTAPRELPDHVPSALREICAKALSLDPADRFREAGDLHGALERYLDHRESHVLCDQAERELDEWRSAPPPDGTEPGGRARHYRQISQAISSFRHSALLWPGNDAAKHGERRARLLLARRALELGDLGIAQNNLDGLEGADAAELARAVAAARDQRRRAARFAGRIGGLLVLAQAVVLGGLALFGVREVGRFVDAEIYEQLQRLRPAVAIALQQSESPTSAELDRIADQLGRRDSLGVALVASDGTVLADSTLDPVGPAAAQARPEVRDALEIGEGTAIHQGGDGEHVLSLASRWRDDQSATEGVLVLSLPRSVLRAELQPILMATGAALLVTFLLSSLVILRATRSLHEAVQKAL